MSDLLYTFLNYANLALNTVCIILTLIILKNLFKTKQLITWVLLLMHLIFDFIATLTWGLLLNQYGISKLIPYPSISDWLWFASYSCFSLSMLSYYILIKRNLENKTPTKGLAWVIGFTVFLFIASNYLYSTNNFFYKDITGALYVALPSAIVLSCIPLIRLFRKGKLSRQWLYLCISGLLYITGEICWLIESINGAPSYLSHVIWAVRFAFVINALYKIAYSGLLPLARDLVFENINDALFILSDDNIILDLNMQSKSLITKGFFKQARDEIIGLNVKELFNTGPNELRTYDLSKSIELRHESRNYSINSTLVKSRNKLFGKIITIQDVTEAKKAEELKLRIEKDKEVNDLRNQFLMRVSHELRQPLVPILGYAEQLLTKNKKYENKKAVAKIIENTNLLKTIINKLLTVVSLQSGTELYLQPIKLKKLINESLMDYQTNFGFKNLKVTKSFIKDPELLIDESKIKEMIYNIIDNAVKNTSKGGIKVSLNVTGNDAVMTVQDTGLGIDSAMLDELKRNVYTAKTTPELLRKGVGMGLLLVNLVVKAHNGKLSIESKQGKGTRIEVKLPIKH